MALTYTQVAQWSHQIAWALNASCINRQSTIATYSPNNIWCYVAMLGIQRAGCIWVPLNARASVADTIAHLNRTGSSWLFYHTDYRHEIDEFFAQVPTLKGAIAISDAHVPPTHLINWVDQECLKPFPLPEHDPSNEIFRITSSGGTTGTPKAIIHSQVGCTTNVATFLSLYKYTGLPNYLLCMPMTHSAGSMSFPILALGGTIHIMAKPDLDIMLEIIERETIHFLALTPTSLYTLLARPDIHERDFSSLNYLFIGAAPLSADKLSFALDTFGPIITQSYGQTEAPTALTCMLPQDYVEIKNTPSLQHRLLSCGRATPFARIEIMDSEGNLLPIEERGEIVVRSGMVMQGYMNDDSLENPKKFGWHHTGDVGYKDSEGFVYIVDRIRDLIITGGFNVFPADVEQVILSHPAVQDCAVIGVPDDKWGESVKAIVQLKPRHSVSEEQIIELCRAHLGSVKSPKSVDFWSHLPKSAVGKVLKKEIKSVVLQKLNKT
ncbi:class I adenylate-forming enzyme family protein [Alcaligenes endophyticus]|uniref:AMP-binding protein n=1 Tax=Alcaligenes endophyticus TaxID=1929088 RepID=A0ABT8EF43_9BURK|nr:AMP-binding protein [Alcaligenes endophyticus]MDN4119875.1 AMP-binding protein [Alcaligenes endophyticus]